MRVNMTNEKETKQSSLVVILVVIIITLVFIVGILIGSKMNNTKQEETNKIVDKKDKKDPKEPKEKKQEKEPEVKSSKTIDEEALVEEAKKLIPIGMCGYPAMPLEKKTLTVNQLSDEVKGAMIIYRINNIDIDNPVHIKEKDIKRYFSDISFLNYLKKSKDNQYSLAPGIMSYSNDEYIIETYATGCEGAHEGDTIKYLNYTLKDDILTLVYAYYWETYDYDNSYYSFYKEKKGKVIYDAATYSEKNGEVKYLYKGKEISYDAFDKYEFTFDISNDTLLFQKMTYKAV